MGWPQFITFVNSRRSLHLSALSSLARHAMSCEKSGSAHSSSALALPRDFLNTICQTLHKTWHDVIILPLPREVQVPFSGKVELSHHYGGLCATCGTRGSHAPTVFPLHSLAPFVPSHIVR